VAFIKREVSDSCSEEIFKVETTTYPECLSYGFTSATVFLNLTSIDPTVKELEVQLPVHLEVTSVQQLK
jgi:hypothetical protein